MTPVYGMAECSVGLTFPPLGRGPLIDTIERDAFMCSGAAIPASDKSTSALRFVSCGLPLSGHQVRVVDDMGHELEERREGRLEFTARSATRGYFRNPIASTRLIHDGWLDSGDRAYIADGEIPEGTFTRAPGLMPFHLGAFAAAVAAGVPVLPVAIRGTRSMLRDKQWMPRRGRVIVTIDKPITPPRLPDAFTAAVQLRDAARGSISRHCGEPDMLAT